MSTNASRLPSFGLEGHLAIFDTETQSVWLEEAREEGAGRQVRQIEGHLSLQVDAGLSQLLGIIIDRKTPPLQLLDQAAQAHSTHLQAERLLLERHGRLPGGPTRRLLSQTQDRRHRF